MIAEAPTLSHRRGLVRTLISPHPLGESLPALFQEDGFTQRFMSAFDAALAPIFATMDNLPTYFDPWLTPPDFLEWLGSWFGLALDDSWSVERRRAVLAAAFEFYRMRGTVKGLKAQIETLTGGTDREFAPRVAEFCPHGSGRRRRSGRDQRHEARRAGRGGEAGARDAQSPACQTIESTGCCGGD